MRNAFADEITELSKTDTRIMVLSGDIGNKLFDSFKLVDPKRFINCGIAEANMIGVAAGLALNGLRPIVYTIAPFTTTRCFEQIRIDIAYHEAPVIIVGTGSGLSYAELGPTHHSLEDIAIMRMLPGMQVFAPCDAIELRMVLQAVLKSSYPSYIRIGKKGEPAIHKTKPNFKIGEPITLQVGKDVLMLATGTIVFNTMEAAKILSKNGISAEVVSVPTIKPFDKLFLLNRINQFRLVVTVEEHSKRGGLGGVVSEIIASLKVHPPQIIIGTPDEFMHENGSQFYAQKKYGLDPMSISSKILNILEK
jgi:transketolase